jgi:hypothetical protein
MHPSESKGIHPNQKKSFVKRASIISHLIRWRFRSRSAVGGAHGVPVSNNKKLGHTDGDGQNLIVLFVLF